MNSLILLTPPDVTLETFVSKLEVRWKVERAAQGYVIESGPKSRVYFYEDVEFRNYIHEPEFFSESLVKRFDQLKSASLFIFDYSNRGLAAAVVSEVADDASIEVDDGSGKSFRGNVFVQMVRARMWM